MIKYTNKKVVLDLDNTLIAASSNVVDDYDFKLHFDELTYYVKKRHYCDEFLSFCFSYFGEVIVWSAGENRYVNLIVDNIFFNERPTRIYTRDDIPNISDNYDKKLNNIITDISNTYIIDDRVNNFRDNIENGVLITPYHGNRLDDDLLRIQSWFLEDDVVNSNVYNNPIKGMNTWRNEKTAKYLTTHDRLYHIAI